MPPPFAHHVQTVDRWGCVAIDLPCPGCSTSLRGLPVAAGCPSCQRSVGLSVARHLNRVDDQSRISVDVLCVGCRYNLRSQPLLGRCPECSRAAVLSALFSSLYHAPLAWLRRVAIGCGLLAWSLVGLIALFLVFWGFAFAPFLGVRFGPILGVWWSAGTAAALAIVALVLLLAGLALLTSREPAPIGHAESVTPRRVSRFCWADCS